ncbi:MAG TPA: MlaD family protein [Burkholderiaceae bacterium]|nr:MlaD family protein [Burkholderiaceae bacterium]
MSDRAPPVPEPARDAAPAGAASHLEFKATLLLIVLVLLVGGAALYLSWARGAFERTQQLVLVAEDAEGVGVGMDLTFAGFPIGRVRRIELAPDGNARIVVDVPVKDAHWLRETSVFAIQRGVVGNTNIRAYTGVLSDPPLPDGAVRTVLRGDAAGEIPRLMAEARQLLSNLNAISAEGSAVNESLTNLRGFTAKLNATGGALDRTNTLLARLDGLAAKADTQVFGSDGMLRDARQTVQQLNNVLGDARASLQRVDAVLEEARAVGANARVATTDLGALRADVETSLRNIDALIQEVNRKWPFAKKDAEIKLP